VHRRHLLLQLARQHGIQARYSEIVLVLCLHDLKVVAELKHMLGNTNVVPETKFPSLKVGKARERSGVFSRYFSGRNVPITLPLTTVKKRFFSTTLISGNSTSSILVSRAGSSASGIVESSKIIKVAAAVPSKR